MRSHDDEMELALAFLQQPRAQPLPPRATPPTPTCSAASPRGDRGAFERSTAATRGRSTGSRSGCSATAAAPRTPCRRRSRRSGARPAATGPSAAPARPGSTRSRATRSSTAPARAATRSAEVPDTPSGEPGPSEQAEAGVRLLARPPRARGAARARARGARARLLGRPLAERGRRVPRHPARYRQDAHAQRPRAARGRCSKERSVIGPEFDDLVGADAPPEERERLLRAHEAARRRRPAARAAARARDRRAGPGAPRSPLLPQRGGATPAPAARGRDRRSLAFCGGYLGGQRGSGDVRDRCGRDALHRAEPRPRSLSVGARSTAGNWPMRLSVDGLARAAEGRLLRAPADTQGQAGRARAARSSSTRARPTSASTRRTS